MVYVISLFFKTTASAVRFTFFSIYFCSLIPVIMCSVLRLFSPKSAETVTNAFLWNPLFCLATAMGETARNYGLKQQAQVLIENHFGCNTVAECCETLGCTTNTFSTEAPGIGRFLVAMLIQVVVFIFVIYAIESKWYRRNGAQAADPARADAAPLDTDVLAEQQRVRGRGATADDVVVMSGVGKRFKSKHAVRDVSLGIKQHECFGLLGVNGAGKTTLFKMMTGDEPIGYGNITIAGHSVAKELPAVQSKIGYVPQFDALLGYMTGYEVLTFYTGLRGLPRHSIPAEVSRLVSALALTKHADRQCGTYSGGNKRKLGVAIALIGDPQIILMDEPTTGMDPGSRRFLWDVVLQLVHSGRSIVLTTHSMEECEALCTRLTIMVDGEFKCLGAQQHLKSRFGNGYLVQLTVGDVC